MLLMMILPMLIAMLVAVGGIPAATDLVAGEERMTFEPLLTTRPSRMSILTGKYLTINLFSFASVISTLIGMLLAFFITPAPFPWAWARSAFNLDPGSVVLCLIVTLILGMTFSGLQLAISTYSRSFKE